ncbi:MAG: TonB-dependent receptor domain-containing protein [Bacteroidota bacterium]
MFRTTILAILCLLTMSFAQAQNGSVRGQVIDDATGEGLIGVSVAVKGTTKGTITDFEGKFEISLPAGTYELQASFVSFETVNITNVVVTGGQVNLLNGIRMKESVEVLESVVVTAEAIRSSEAALITIKRKAPNVMDGISAANFRKIGDSDAADAAKRVTGVSVEGGKYVYVRGIGDRYTKTTLNNVDIPGLDPDRNSLQMDIFPTSLIDNMVVMKSSVAEMSADFTGGVVNIETKDFPDERVFDVSLSMGVNPSMHFNPNYITYQGSKTDFLGFDNGMRALPLEARKETIPSPVSGNSDQTVNRFLKKFDPTLGAQNSTSFMDYGMGLSYANQLSMRGERKLGFIFSGTYKNSTRFYDDMTYGEYQRLIDPSEYELRYATIQNGAVGENSVLLGGMAGVAFKTQKNKLQLTALHLQNGESRAGQFRIDNDGEAVGQSGYIAQSNNLEYNQRGLTNILLNGEHYNANGSWKIDWRLSPTLSKLSDPDIRKTAFTLSPTDTSFISGAGGNPSRIWRNLDEVNAMGKVDVTKEYSLFQSAAKLKFGLSHVYKERDYEILSYDLQFFGQQPEFNFNPNNVLKSEFLYPNGTVYYSSGNNVPNPNAYNSNVQYSAAYVSNEFSPVQKLKTIVGLRLENYVQRHTGRDVQYASFGTGNNLVNAKVLDALDLFPSANFIYALNDQQNLRVSYSKTIARPSFKELSFAQILDPITNRIFNGGLFTYNDWDGKLTETRINNFDLRWEHFMANGQLLSVSAFYKAFDNPIELVRIPEQQTSTEYQPRNVGDGRLVGVELEVRKSLDFVAPRLSKFNFSGNVTVVQSQIEMTDREYNSRLTYVKEGETLKNTRQMAGQAPYIVNAGFGYEDATLGLDAGLFYNVKGSTLSIVGAGLFPDVYAEPFHSLNFNLNKTLGANKRSSVGINVSNLMNDIREEVYKGFRAENQTFTRFSPGVAVSVGLKYSL